LIKSDLYDNLTSHLDWYYFLEIAVRATAGEVDMHNSPFNEEQIVDTELGKFVDGRRSFYDGLHIGHLAKKDLLMIGMAKGESTITGAIKHSFAAYESSSEEGQWGTSLQKMVIYLSDATDSGDMTLTDRASQIQWIIEVKPARNTVNSDSLPQILRGLKEKVTLGNNTHTPTIKLHKPMIGVLRGNPTQEKPTRLSGLISSLSQRKKKSALETFLKTLGYRSMQ